MTKFFLQLTSVSAFIALAAISGYSLAGNSRAHCLAIASVVKVAGLCEAPKRVSMGQVIR